MKISPNLYDYDHGISITKILLDFNVEWDINWLIYEHRLSKQPVNLFQLISQNNE